MIIIEKVALVTGGASGLGKQMARTLLEKGARGIVIFDIFASDQAAKDLKAEFEQKFHQNCVSCVHGDVRRPQEYQTALDRAYTVYGRLDIVCNNAGITEKLSFLGSYATTDLSNIPATSSAVEEWLADTERVVDVDLVAVMTNTRQALLTMMRNGSKGVIINTASMGGLLAMPFSPVYCAAKHGVVGFTRSLEFTSRFGIRVNAICPTFINTPLLRDGMAQSSIFKGVVDSLGEPLKPEMVGEGVVQLVEDDSRSGEVMRITHKHGIDFHNFGPASGKFGSASKKDKKISSSL